jgi:hypothetical protein
MKTRKRTRQRLTSVKQLYELVTSPGTEVTNIILPNDDVVGYPGNIPRITTAGKKLTWHCCLRNDSSSTQTIRVPGWIVGVCPVLWYSVISIQNVPEPPKVKRGDYLGHIKHELEFRSVSFNHQFVSGGPMNYAFSALRHKNVRANASWRV